MRLATNRILNELPQLMQCFVIFLLHSKTIVAKNPNDRLDYDQTLKQNAANNYEKEPRDFSNIDESTVFNNAYNTNADNESGANDDSTATITVHESDAKMVEITIPVYYSVHPGYTALREGYTQVPLAGVLESIKEMYQIKVNEQLIMKKAKARVRFILILEESNKAMDEIMPEVAHTSWHNMEIHAKLIKYDAMNIENGGKPHNHIIFMPQPSEEFKPQLVEKGNEVKVFTSKTNTLCAARVSVFFDKTTTGIMESFSQALLETLGPGDYQEVRYVEENGAQDKKIQRSIAVLGTTVQSFMKTNCWARHVQSGVQFEDEAVLTN
ncbi:hypothetical protein ENBRE01_1086 [Enteropsectra breve]|nr:hypothetical protein ENBRE01_1086 [Enteropsectra breve]